MVKIYLNFKYIDTFSPDLDPTLEAWYRRLTRMKDRKRGMIGDVSWMEIDFLKVSELQMLRQYDDSNIKGFRCIIKLPETQLDDITPDFLPNRVIKNWDDTDPENPIELPDTYKTWREWIGKNYTITEIDGYAYFNTQAGGRDLTFDELCMLLDDNILLVDNIPVLE